MIGVLFFMAGKELLYLFAILGLQTINLKYVPHKIPKDAFNFTDWKLYPICLSKK